MGDGDCRVGGLPVASCEAARVTTEALDSGGDPLPCVRQNNCVHYRYNEVTLAVIASLRLVHNKNALRYRFQRDREVDESTPTNDLRMIDRELVPPLDLVMFQRVDVH